MSSQTVLRDRRTTPRPIKITLAQVLPITYFVFIFMKYIYCYECRCDTLRLESCRLATSSRQKRCKLLSLCSTNTSTPNAENSLKLARRLARYAQGGLAPFTLELPLANFRASFSSPFTSYLMASTGRSPSPVLPTRTQPLCRGGPK